MFLLDQKLEVSGKIGSRVYVTGGNAFMGVSGASGNWFSFLDRRDWVSLVVLFPYLIWFVSSCFVSFIGLFLWVFCFRYVLYPYLIYALHLSSYVVGYVYVHGVCLSRWVDYARWGLFFLYLFSFL